MDYQEYKLEKHVWTDADFDRMIWHDNSIHGFAPMDETYECAFDIDYITQWVQLPDERRLSFWVAPATFVFENVRLIDVSFLSESGYINIDNIKKSDQVYAPDGEHFDWLWTINLHQGEISLRATGYKLYVRSKPILSQLQRLTLSQRGNVSFHKSVPDNESL